RTCQSQRASVNGRKRRNLVIAGRSGEGPFTIRFADLRYRALPAGGLLSSRLPHPIPVRIGKRQVAGSARIGHCRPPTSPPRGGCYAKSELEGLSAPLTGVLSDLSLTRDNTNEVDPPASGVAADGRTRRCHRGRRRGGAAGEALFHTGHGQ